MFKYALLFCTLVWCGFSGDLDEAYKAEMEKLDSQYLTAQRQALEKYMMLYKKAEGKASSDADKKEALRLRGRLSELKAIYSQLGSNKGNHRKIPVDATFVGKWAWKHSKNFEESFDDSRFLPGGAGTAFTIEMWVKLHKPEGISSLTLNTIGDAFTFGVIRYRNMPFVHFNVPKASKSKSGLRLRIATGTGWLHLAGVYDPVDKKSIRLYVNGQEVATRKLQADPSLPASIFIFRGEFKSKESFVLIDDVRMTRGILYTDSFMPRRNLSYDKDTAVLFRMEKKQVGDLYEVPNEANEKKKAARFTSGQFVEVDSQTFKLAVDRTVELEEEMFSHYKKKLAPEKYRKLVEMWPQAPKALRHRKLNEFAEMLKAESLPKDPAKGSDLPK